MGTCLHIEIMYALNKERTDNSSATKKTRIFTCPADEKQHLSFAQNC